MKFPVSESKENDLLRRMQALGILESDLVEDFVRGSGAGGQKINKTSVVVTLHHVPTGIAVRCQETRSQAMNRFFARRILVEKIEERLFKKQSEKQHAIEKVKRQKRKRSKRAKEKMLEGKSRHGEKKALRQRPRGDD